MHRDTSAFFQQGVCSQFILYYSKCLISRYLCKQTNYIQTHHLVRINRDITDSLDKVGWVCPKGAQRRAERKMLSWQQGDDQADQFRSCSSWCSGGLWWKLDLLLWPRDRVPSGSMLALPDPRRPDRANPPTNFWWSLFLTALAWSTCTGFPLDRQSTRNTMLRF